MIQPVDHTIISQTLPKRSGTRDQSTHPRQNEMDQIDGSFAFGEVRRDENREILVRWLGRSGRVTSRGV